MDLRSIARHFITRDAFVGAVPYGEGHINDTYAVTFTGNSTSDAAAIADDGKSEYRMILQRINRNVFRDPPGLMRNIRGVTEFLKEKILEAGGDPLRETLTVILADGGEPYYLDEDGEYWRMYIFIENTLTLQSCRNDQDFYNSGAAFGRFQRLLADYPAGSLAETIPDFHNTPARFRALEQAIREDRAGRVRAVRAEIEFALARKAMAGELARLLETGSLPLRVTHNDTKLNNILLDAVTGRGVCVIDLDTVMPGAACFDFGDSIRFGASTAAEDETDLSQVSMSLRLFEVYADGYLSVAKEFLTEQERRSLAAGAKIMTFECGIRFLTDYLNGDTYFKIHREHHNLDRCRTQFRLVEDMEAKAGRMEEIIAKRCGQSSMT